MKTKTLVIPLTLGFATAAVCLAGDPKIEQALRKLDAQWSAAASAKNVDKTVSYYSDDAIVLPPNTKVATTKAAIRAQWKGDLDSMIKGSWKATRVEVAKSGDMAYVSGTYDWTSKDPSGKTVKDHGKYLEVFEKQADGSWKCTADCWNSDLPVPGSAPAKKK
jgi:ketosteroid isomerase-like protein